MLGGGCEGGGGEGGGGEGGGGDPSEERSGGRELRVAASMAAADEGMKGIASIERAIWGRSEALARATLGLKSE